MKKPASLRAAIAATLPDLARDADRLVMWVERGAVRATQGPQRGFAWEYDLIIVAENYTLPPEDLFFTVTDWMRLHQPDLLQPDAAGFPFEVDVIDDRAFDVKITLPLREVVAATPSQGGWSLEVQEEPVHFPDAAPLRPDSAPLASVWAQDSEILFQVAPDQDT
ncbi:phage tail protein [Novosphingobium sp. BW1]|uniref:phage tail protein n=1 Tax=Novosphingobium sp. BW1 TaxID=2592621 RepID=UPI0013968C3E|nr:phage tail protein [Novosphingobium sp. BW1]